MLKLQEGNKAQSSEEQRQAELDAASVEKQRLGQNFLDEVLVNSALSLSTGGIKKWFNDAVSAVVKPTEIYKRYEQLEVQSSKIRGVLGLGSEKSKEFNLLVANNAASFAELGFTIDDVVKTYTSVISEFNTNTTISDKNLQELKATAKVTGVDVGDLAGKFRGVGVSLGEIPDKMLEVVNIARDSGVAVSAVSKGVADNLDKMNLYNFDGGVKGLAKMSTQAARLGIDMNKIFTVVDQVFNPEGAIDLAANLQRLGVSAGALLDPLKLMDLSQNDPTELQNQIINMSKDFVRFNKEMGQFEILPGEKRRLNEIGKALGMNNGELQKMALNAANLEFKMKQIKFPSSIANKEDRELIGTLATVNKEGIAEIKVRKFDETGKDTGTYEIIEASQLTKEQIERLRQEQQLGEKTMEDIAKESLTEMQRTNYLVESIVTAIGYGLTTTTPVQDFYQMTTKSLREGIFEETKGGGQPVGKKYRETEFYRDFGNKMYEQGTDILKTIYDELGMPSFEDLGKTVSDGFKGILDEVSGLVGGFDFGDVAENFSMENLKNLFGMGGSETDQQSDFSERVATKTTNKIIESPKALLPTTPSIEYKPLEINEKLDININVTLDPNSQNQALSTLMTRALENYFQGGQNKTNINMILDEMSKMKSNQGLTPVNEKTSYVSAPGKNP
jgi:hypothetical protein